MSSDEIGTGLSSLGKPRDHIDVWYSGGLYEMRDFTRQLGNNPHGHNGQMPPGNYIQTNSAGALLPGFFCQDLDNVWSASTQGPFVDAHVYTGVFYDWLLKEFDRNSYDDQGASMLSSVNWTGTLYTAFWTGRQVVYSAFTSGTRSYAACPDIVAHEWGHGITDFCAGLAYYWESGALNESFSNMLGAAFEWAHDTLDTPDWYLGENMYFPTAPSMSDPPSRGRPGYHGGPNWVDIDGCVPGDGNDYCGVHTNMGVGDKWFYLLSDGGTYREVTVGGIGVENAVQIAYHANAYYWSYWTDFHDAALGTYFAALDLDPSGTWATEVTNAWLAVNVDIQTKKLVFDFPLGTPRTVLRNTATVIELGVAGLQGGVPVPGTGQVHYSVDGSDFVTVDLNQVGDNQYEAQLPALDCSQTLEYYFSAEEEGGTRFYEPEPTSPIAAAVVSRSETSFEDDFENDLGWTVSGNAVYGVWERGVPPTDGSDGAPPTDCDGSGQCYVTGLDYWNDVEYGVTYLVSPRFDLEGTDGVVRYAWWFHNRCNPAEIAGDPLYVWVSDDDGASWTLVEVIGPNPGFEGAWHVSEFLVSDFVTPSSQVRVRFEISDIGLPTCVEAAIDAFSISSYFCDDQTTCCVGRVGDANGQSGDEPTISDISTLIDAKFITGTCDGVIVCYAEADVNQSGGTDPTCDDVTISDISILIDYLFITGPETATLLECL